MLSFNTITFGALALPLFMPHVLATPAPVPGEIKDTYFTHYWAIYTWEDYGCGGRSQWKANLKVESGAVGIGNKECEKVPTGVSNPRLATGANPPK
jgi:hypothetical protein